MTKLFVFAFVALAGCSMVKKGTSTGGGGGGGGGGAAKGPLGDTMADAVKYERGDTITAALGCHTSGYAKLELPAGAALHFDVTVTTPKDEACISIGYLKDTGGTAGISDEVCSSATKRYDVTVPAGTASQLQLSENGVCQGATVAIVVK